MLKYIITLSLIVFINSLGFSQKVNGVINSASATTGNIKYSIGPSLNLKTADVIITGLGESQLDEDIWIYPNPASNILNLKSVKPILEVTLVDQKGTEYEVPKIAEDQLNIEKLSPGIYFLYITWKTTLNLQS